MNKKAITLVCIIILLASLQLACSFSDLIGYGGDDRPQFPPQDSGEKPGLSGARGQPAR